MEPYVDEKFQNNILLTQTERLTMNGRPANPKYARNKNVLVIGGSGSGKTRFYVKPNLMQMHSSYCVTDPNGYLKVTDITFEVDEQGKVTVKNADGNEVKANGNKLTVTDKTKSPTPETPWTPMIPSTRNLKVTKKWLGTNGNKITVPVDKIEVELYKDGKATGQKLELNKANSWTGEFKDLKAYESIENSKAYEYTVKEVGENNNSIKLGNKLFKVTYSGNMKDGIEVVNTESPALSPSIPSEKPKKSKLAKTGIGASASIYSGILAISGGIMLFLKKRNQK